MKAKTQSKKALANINLSQQTFADLRNSVIVVSLAANLFIFTTWLVLETTEQFNADLIAYLQS